MNPNPSSRSSAKPSASANNNLLPPPTNKRSPHEETHPKIYLHHGRLPWSHRSAAWLYAHGRSSIFRHPHCFTRSLGSHCTRSPSPTRSFWHLELHYRSHPHPHRPVCPPDRPRPSWPHPRFLRTGPPLNPCRHESLSSLHRPMGWPPFYDGESFPLCADFPLWHLRPAAPENKTLNPITTL